MSARFRRGTWVTAAAGLLVLLTALPAVAFGGTRTGATRGTDAPRAQEWWLAGLNAPQAWQASRGGGVTVAVLSTGVSATHPDLAGSVLTGPDYTVSGRVAGGPYWGMLGTAVASIIAGHGHGGSNGITGIAPTAKILSIRVNLEYNDPLNSSAAITRRLPGAIAAGIRYAVAHGAKVIDLPLDPAGFATGGASPAAGGSAAEAAAVRAALAAGVVLIAPGGDDGPGAGRVNYPAAYPGVIAVAAADRQGRLAGFTGRRSYVTLSAPGVNLLTASMVPGGRSGYVSGYASLSTSSLASAMVAGVTALIVSRYPDLTVTEVGRALAQAATGPGREISAERAMTAAAAIAGAAARSSAPATPAATGSATPRTSRAAGSGHATARPAGGGTAGGSTAGTVLRDAVYVVGALIAILAGVLLLTRARANRRAVPHTPGRGAPPRQRGQHEQHRDNANPVSGYTEPDTVTFNLRRLASPDSPAASGWPASSGWPAPDQDSWPGNGRDWHGNGRDWQGRGIGEIAHTAAEPPGLAMDNKPKAARSGQRQAAPPWAPAPAPSGDTGPLPLLQSDLGLAAAPVPGEYPAAPADGFGWFAGDFPGADPDGRPPAINHD